MAAYRRVHDSRHLQADCQEPRSGPKPYGNRVLATFTSFLPESTVTAGNGSWKAAVALRDVSEAVYRVSLRTLFCSPIRRAESWSQHGSFCTWAGIRCPCYVLCTVTISYLKVLWSYFDLLDDLIRITGLTSDV